MEHIRHVSAQRFCRFANLAGTKIPLSIEREVKI